MKSIILLLLSLIVGFGLVVILIGNNETKNEPSDSQTVTSAETAQNQPKKTSQLTPQKSHSKETNLTQYDAEQEKKLQVLEELVKSNHHGVGGLQIDRDSFNFREDIMELLDLTEQEYTDLNQIGTNILEDIKKAEAKNIEDLGEIDGFLTAKIISDKDFIENIVGEYRYNVSDLIGERKTQLLNSNFEKMLKESGYDKTLQYKVSDNGDGEAEFQFKVESFDKNGVIWNSRTRKRKIDENNPAFVNERYNHVFEIESEKELN